MTLDPKWDYELEPVSTALTRTQYGKYGYVTEAERKRTATSPNVFINQKVIRDYVIFTKKSIWFLEIFIVGLAGNQEKNIFFLTETFLTVIQFFLIKDIKAILDDVSLAANQGTKISFDPKILSFFLICSQTWYYGADEPLVPTDEIDNNLAYSFITGRQVFPRGGLVVVIVVVVIVVVAAVVWWW